MSSIFDLKTSISELSSANDGISKMVYEQVAPSRDVTGPNFSNGPQHFRFEVSGQKWMVPSRSYFRARWQLTTGVGAVGITLADNIAPNMAMMGNLYQSGEVRIADKTVSRVSDFMAQIESLEGRLTKSKGWLNSIGKGTNFWDAKQRVRQSQASSDGKTQDGDQLPYEVVTTQANLDTPAPVATTIAYTKVDGVVTFAGAGAVNTDLNFKVGDFLVITQATANGLNTRLEVIAVPVGQLTMTVRAVIQTDIGAAQLTFSRIRPVSVEPSRRSPFFETVWQPCLSLFKVEHAIPSCRGEIVLNPQTSVEYQRRGIESTLGIASKVPGVNYQLQLVNLYFYMCTVEGPRCDDITYLLDLEQTRCQSDNVLSPDFSQKTFDVSPSTHALTLAFQDIRVGANTALSASKFKTYDNAAVPTLSQELKMNRMFISYSGVQKPNPDSDPNFVPGTDYTVQRYVESQIGSGAFFDSGGAETLEEFHERGAYYYFPWQRDGTDRSTRATINQSFAATQAEIANTRILLFDHSKQVARIKVSQGRVTDVQLEDS